jgi:hypothetical protein
MQQPRLFLQYLTFTVLLVLPVIAILALQSRAAERHRDRPGADKTRQAVESPAFTGFPYIRVAQADLLKGQAITTFGELVKRLEGERGRNHPDTLIARNNYANALLAEGKLAEAEMAQRKLLEDMEASLTPDHPDVFRCRFNIALNLRMQGRNADALAEMEAVYEGWRVVLGEGHPRTQEALLVLEKLKPGS